MILTGIVGAGKTTMIESLTEDLAREGYQVLKFDGDDVSFRTEIQRNSQFFIETIREQGIKKPVIFVDEVQKIPEIFDAIKLAFDKLKASFILSGSNPAYLKTEANHRLQRRGAMYSLMPFSMSEIALHEKLIESHDFKCFSNLLLAKTWKDVGELPQIQRPKKINDLVDKFLVRGGLPLAYNAANEHSTFEQIKLTAERGVTDTFLETLPAADMIRQFLATQNSREFTYQGLFQKLRTSKRYEVNKVIDHLLNHGYLYSKRPFLEDYELSKKTYHSIYSWVDPGIVSYYLGSTSLTEQDSGFRLEGYVQTRLVEYLEHIPLKIFIYYHKPFEIRGADDTLVFKDGEIDFMIRIANRSIPIEVKKTSKVSDIDLSGIKKYLKDYKNEFGIVLYGGAPFKDAAQRLVFYPYWML